MQKWRCIPCDYVYDPEKGDPENGIDYVYDPEKGDPENGIAPGTAFEDLPADWVCPDCGAGKDLFEAV